MSIFNNREDFPYSDYHYFNLDFIVKKMNELVEYVRTKTGIPKETADIYYVPKCDGNDAETGNIRIDVGMDKDNEDCENYMLRPYSHTVETQNRGTIGFDGSESESKSPFLVLKSHIMTGIKMWFDSITKTLNIQGKGEDYEKIKLNGLSNHAVQVKGLSEPEEVNDAVNLNYLQNNYLDTTQVESLLTMSLDDVPMFRSSTVTGSSACSKDEIQEMIDESVPSTSTLMSTLYNPNEPQFLHPSESGGNYAIKWRVGLGTTESPTDSFVGFTTYGSSSFGGCVISGMSDGSGFGWCTYREGLDEYIQMRFVPDINGVFHYPTELRLGVPSTAVKVCNMALPTSDFDGANKRYVDEAVQSLEARITELMLKSK